MFNKPSQQQRLKKSKSFLWNFGQTKPQTKDNEEYLRDRKSRSLALDDSIFTKVYRSMAQLFNSRKKQEEDVIKVSAEAAIVNDMDLGHRCLDVSPDALNNDWKEDLLNQLHSKSYNITTANKEQKEPDQLILVLEQNKRDHVKERLDREAIRRNEIKLNRQREQIDAALFETIRLLKQERYYSQPPLIMNKQ